MVEQAGPTWHLSMHFVILLLVAFFLVPDCNAGTLYDRSLQKLERNAQRASPQDYTFVVLGDSRENDEIFRKSLELATTFNPLFVLHEGDFSSRGSLEEVDYFLKMVQKNLPDIPIFVIPGNHEQKLPFKEEIGPLNFVIDVPRLGLKVIAVDNSDYLLTAAQLGYLGNKLTAPRKFTFVTMHVPPATSRWHRHTFSQGAPELIALLAEKKVTAAFYGHIHLYDRDDIKGVPHIISGGAGAPLSWIGFPGDPSYHIVVVRVKDGKVTYEMVKIKN
jgi:Icc protein